MLPLSLHTASPPPGGYAAAERAGVSTASSFLAFIYQEGSAGTPMWNPALFYTLIERTVRMLFLSTLHCRRQALFWWLLHALFSSSRTECPICELLGLFLLIFCLVSAFWLSSLLICIPAWRVELRINHHHRCHPSSSCGALCWVLILFHLSSSVGQGWGCWSSEMLNHFLT